MGEETAEKLISASMSVMQQQYFIAVFYFMHLKAVRQADILQRSWKLHTSDFWKPRSGVGCTLNIPLKSSVVPQSEKDFR